MLEVHRNNSFKCAVIVGKLIYVATVVDVLVEIDAVRTDILRFFDPIHNCNELDIKPRTEVVDGIAVLVLLLCKFAHVKLEFERLAPLRFGAAEGITFKSDVLVALVEEQRQLSGCFICTFYYKVRNILFQHIGNRSYINKVCNIICCICAAHKICCRYFSIAYVFFTRSEAYIPVKEYEVAGLFTLIPHSE